MNSSLIEEMFAKAFLVSFRISLERVSSLRASFLCRDCVHAWVR